MEFSYQLYSSRNFGSFDETLAMVAAAGFTQSEGYGALYADAQKTKDCAAALKANGVAMPTAHFDIDQIENSPNEVIDIAGNLGIKTVYCPYLNEPDRPTTAAGWHEFGTRLQNAGQPLRAAGVGFGWHNHDFEFAALPDGSMPQDAIFAGGPDLEWEVDIAWVIRGGADPLAWIAKYGNRITAVHVKDIAAAGENSDEDGWADLGYGTVDWAGLAEALKSSKASVFVMEHDNPEDDKRFATRSIASARKIWG